MCTSSIVAQCSPKLFCKCGGKSGSGRGLDDGAHMQWYAVLILDVPQFLSTRAKCALRIKIIDVSKFSRLRARM